MSKVGKIPDFTGGSEIEQEPVEGNLEVKQTVGEEPAEEKETPAENASLAEKTSQPRADDDIGKKEVSEQNAKDAAIIGLEMEKSKLLAEISELRGTRRNLRQDVPQGTVPEGIIVPEEKKVVVDNIHPEDREIIKKVIEQEGYVKKDEAHAMLYKDIEQQQLNEWLDAHPEFKIENDPLNRNWGALMNQYQLYVKPKDPSQTKEFLERALHAIPENFFANGQNAKENLARQQKLETAGMGSGGASNPSSPESSIIPSGMLEQEAREEYRRGGYTEEEINELLTKK